ncbi:MAG TPA: SIMPL domain-containing protein [Candidatus Elarobacter sp.]|nr:SIMPL domain-containing protein [Candidatus Elarobacter sp.]
MRTATLAAAALALLTAASPAAAQTAPPATVRAPSRIEVGGQGTVDRMPDRVIVSFAIVTNDDNATRATSANNATYNALVAKLRGLGIEPAAIKTTGYDLNYNPRPPQPNPQFQQRYGYVATRGVAVTSDHTDQAGAIVDAGVAAGVTSVGGISFGLRDTRAAYRAALAAAVADAESGAQAIAAAAHVRIVRLLTVSAGSYASVPRPVPQLARMAASAGTVPTDVQPSNLSVTASVTVTYEIAP